METLNLSDSTPRSESRLKSLFWPSIQNGADVDYLGTPGYWFAHSWQLFPSFSPWQLASPLWERSCRCFITSAEWGEGTQPLCGCHHFVSLCLGHADVGIECGQGNLWSFASLDPARDLDCFSRERRFRRSDLTVAT